MKKKRTAHFLSRELSKILSYLLATLTPDDLGFLKIHFSEIWTNFSTESSWKEKNANCMSDVGVRITEILDAKKRQERWHCYTDGLSFEHRGYF